MRGFIVGGLYKNKMVQILFLFGVFVALETSLVRVLTLSEINFAVILFLVILFAIAFALVVWRRAMQLFKDNRFDHIPVMLLNADNAGRLTGVSNYWLENFGFGKNEVIGRSIFDFLADESKTYFKEVCSHELVRVGFYKDSPCRFVKKDGECFDALVSAIALKDERGRMHGYQCSITDISLQKQIENQLRESKLLYKKIIYTIPDIFIQTDVDGYINFINDKGLEIIGKYTSVSYIGRNVLSIISPEDRPKAERNIKLMFEKQLGLEQYKLNINGSEDAFCGVNGDVLRDENNIPYGIIFIIRDITQIKKNEQKLIESEEKFRSLVETSPNLTWEILPDGRFVYASPQSLSIFGYKSHELYSMRFFDLLAPGEIERVSKRFTEDVKNRQPVIAFEVKAIHGQNGKEINVDISTSLIFNDKGDVVGLRGIARDITIQKQSEQEATKFKEYLGMVLKSGGIGLWFSNFSKNTTVIDDVWANMLGFTKEELSVVPADSILQSFLHPDDKEMVINHIKESMVNESGANSFEHRMITKSGEIKWVLATVKVVKVDADGMPIEMIGFMKDITDRKIAQIQIAEANSTKDKLFSIIAHDLRNPLNAVIGFSELLVNNHESYETHKIGEYSHCIHSSAINLNSLLENLLDWANTQRGMVAFNPKIIDLDSIINEEVKNIFYVAQKKNIIINSFNNKLMVKADSYLLRIIIRNLLTNAIKYSNPNSKVDIYSLSFKDSTEINVHDYGVGMTEEIKSNLFGLSNNKSQRGTANERGTGLGLLVCKEFVEKHDGKIWVESKLGEGSIFTFSLPN